MSLEEKYGAFTINKIIFYDEEEENKFLEDMKEKYNGHILKINNEKIKGSGKLGFRTKEEKDKLSYLSLTISSTKEDGMKINGYGHRRAIFPLEMYVRKQFDEGKIVSFSARDAINRTDDISRELQDMLSEEKSFDQICKERLQQWKNGEFPNPREKTQVK